ncbi:amidohydrolase family protein [Paenalcaligenes sp. Me52]|uniref:amidohydrolase family protein n=1 Tax=Paenalcaligenes sp. Me52 TaxID=3392038 RepID=UPI003D28E399
MISASPRLDAHVHFYTAHDLESVAASLPYSLPSPHPLKEYLDTLIDAGKKPYLLNNVHLSILPDSENVFASFLELNQLQQSDPQRYGDIHLVGTIMADPDYATDQRLSHPQVAGIRIVLHNAKPTSISTNAYSTPAWQELLTRLQPHHHIHIYACEAESNLRVLRQLPKHITVLIDHLGTCHPERGANEPAYLALLQEAKIRGNVYFKGPGYRTSIHPIAAQPFVEKILQYVGPQRLLLEATDAPHVGTDQEGVPYAHSFTPTQAFDYVERLAHLSSLHQGVSPETLLRATASDIFPNLYPQRPTMNNITERVISFPVSYSDETIDLQGRVFLPEQVDESLPPVVFNSGFTGGVSMYGQLMSKALAARGYRVMTYDVAGFFTNRQVRNTFVANGKRVTRVSLADQVQEMLAAISWCKQNFDQMPAVASWAMGSSASLAAVIELAKQGGEQIPFYIPMSYTSLTDLQNLRADAQTAHRDIMQLDPMSAIPPFDTGTAQTRLGYYPLDVDTQAYVDQQLGAYTDASGVDHWPGCEAVTASSYQEYITFNPEADLPTVTGKLPIALIVHGNDNTLHMPAESVRLHALYSKQQPKAELLQVEDMQHGQQLIADNPIFQSLIQRIDQGIRTR